MLPIILTFALAFIPLAAAQETSDAVQAPDMAEEPATAALVPPVEIAAAEPQPFQPRLNYFPALPPSRPCAAGDVTGLWRLTQVYENPAGAAARDFATAPYQYLLFSGDTTYSTYKGGSAGGDTAVRAQLNAQTQRNLQQFLVQEGGFVFFYRDGIAIDTQACFIVASRQTPFEVGQMLLMPPQGQSTVRLVKVYGKAEDAGGALEQDAGGGQQTSRPRQAQFPEQRQQQRRMEIERKREERRQQRIMERRQKQSQQGLQ